MDAAALRPLTSEERSTLKERLTREPLDRLIDHITTPRLYEHRVLEILEQHEETLARRVRVMEQLATWAGSSLVLQAVVGFFAGIGLVIALAISKFTPWDVLGAVFGS